MVGSGSTPFLKGDVIAGKLFIEAKTKMEPSKSISVKKEWLEKAKAQALSTRKEDYTVAISFGEPICSSNNGYWYSNDPEDLDRTIKRLSEQVKNMSRAVDGLYRAKEGLGNE